MHYKEIDTFSLVGGTALSLKYGHRISIDIDLFSTEDFSNQDLKDFLRNNFAEFESNSSNAAPGVFGYFGEMKADFVKHHKFKLIRSIEWLEGVRFFSSEDIAAMKIFALLQRAKKKDFWDISLLLDIYGLKNIIDFYFEKYPENQMLITVPHALLYFEDAEQDEDPISLKGQTWQSVKQNISKHVNNYLK